MFRGFAGVAAVVLLFAALAGCAREVGTDIEISTVDEQGNAARGVAVEAHKDFGGTLITESVVSTDDSGVASMVLEPGYYEFRARSGTLYGSEKVVVKEGGQSSIRIVLRESVSTTSLKSSMEILLVDESGAQLNLEAVPVTQALEACRPECSTSSALVPRNPFGGASGPGRFSFEFSAPGYENAELEFTLGEGESVKETVVMRKAGQE